jgi:hypothetical protein
MTSDSRIYHKIRRSTLSAHTQSSTFTTTEQSAALSVGSYDTVHRAGSHRPFEARSGELSLLPSSPPTSMVTFFAT